jgi:hypothetical protein
MRGLRGRYRDVAQLRATSRGDECAGHDQKSSPALGAYPA